jgi:hypothetical protein
MIPKDLSEQSGIALSNISIEFDSANDNGKKYYSVNFYRQELKIITKHVCFWYSQAIFSNNV